MRNGKQIRNTATLLLTLAVAGVHLNGLPAYESHAAGQLPPSQNTDDLLGRAAVAEQLATAGRQAVSRDRVERPHLMQSIALLRAACAMYNREPRFFRLLADACTEAGDLDGAISALRGYRSIDTPQVKYDEFTQIELIDLYTQKKQSANDKLDYLKQIVDVAAVPDAVRSHIAYLICLWLDQKGDIAGSKAALDKSLKLNPLNVSALVQKEKNAQADGNRVDRTAALVGLLKANPVQPAVMSALAEELVAAGQIDQAVIWYNRSFELTTKGLNGQLDPGKYLDFAAAQYLQDQPKKADDAALMLLNGNPANVGAAMLRLIIARQSVNAPVGGAQPANPQVVQTAKDNAASALAAQLAMLHAKVLNNGVATTQPAAAPSGNPMADIADDQPKLQAIRSNPQMTNEQASLYNAYVVALADQTWFYAYFDPQPAKATQLLNILRTLKPETDPDVTKLEGFTFLADGKRDEAKVKLSAVADRDPLAAMGMVLINPDAAAASKLVSEHPGGLLGAILADGLRESGGKFVVPAAAQGVPAEAATFPEKLLDMMVKGKTETFYNILAEPLRSSVPFGEPALAHVTLRNASDFDLVVGPGGAIHPDLWFDVKVQGDANQSLPGVAYDRIAGPIVLKANAPQSPGTDQIVRVDVGPLTQILRSHPTQAISLIYSILTNPITQSAGVAPGPCGYRKSFTSQMERAAAPTNNPQDIAALTEPVMTGSTAEKIRAIDLLAADVFQLDSLVSKAQNIVPDVPGPGALPKPPANAAPNPELTKARRDLADTFRSAIQRGVRDPNPLVHYWAVCKQGELSDVNTKASIAAGMVQGKDWEQRVMGLILVNELTPEKAKQICATLLNDPVSYVKDLAQATIDVANLPPPATQPATAQ